MFLFVSEKRAQALAKCVAQSSLKEKREMLTLGQTGLSAMMKILHLCGIQGLGQ